MRRRDYADRNARLSSSFRRHMMQLYIQERLRMQADQWEYLNQNAQQDMMNRGLVARPEINERGFWFEEK